MPGWFYCRSPRDRGFLRALEMSISTSRQMTTCQIHKCTELKQHVCMSVINIDIYSFKISFGRKVIAVKACDMYPFSENACRRDSTRRALSGDSLWTSSVGIPYEHYYYNARCSCCSVIQIRKYRILGDGCARRFRHPFSTQVAFRPNVCVMWTEFRPPPLFCGCCNSTPSVVDHFCGSSLFDPPFWFWSHLDHRF